MSSSSIIGYIDPLVVSPGGRVAVKTSCGQPNIASKVLRLRASHTHPDAPPVVHQLVESVPQQSHQGKLEISRTGSNLWIPSWSDEALRHVDTMSTRFWSQPALPKGTEYEHFLFRLLTMQRPQASPAIWTSQVA